MIWKRNRLYYNDTEINRIANYFNNEIYPGTEIDSFLYNINRVYVMWHFSYYIKKPNLKYIMDYMM